MASYLRPRRGKEATAKSQNIVLKRGEIFFETPAGGVGTGIGRLKMGDGSTSYASLPYFLRQLDLSDNNTKCAFTNVTAATDKSNNGTYLNNIAPTNSLKTLFQNIKQLLLNYNSQLTSLNNDLNNTDKLKIVISTQLYTTFAQAAREVVMKVKEPVGGVCIAEVPVIENSGTGAIGITVGRNFKVNHGIVIYSNRQSQSDVNIYLYSFYRM